MSEQERAAKAYEAGRQQREDSRMGADNARIDGVNAKPSRTQAGGR
jgi:hypothetical protein